MTTYYLRTAHDDPHLPSPTMHGLTRCGRDLTVMRAVSDLQVLVYLPGRHCGGCTPALHRVDTTRSPQRRAA